MTTPSVRLPSREILARQVFDVLRTSPEPLTAAEVAHALDERPGRVSDSLRGLLKRGVVQRVPGPDQVEVFGPGPDESLDRGWAYSLTPEALRAFVAEIEATEARRPAALDDHRRGDPE